MTNSLISDVSRKDKEMKVKNKHTYIETNRMEENKDQHFGKMKITCNTLKPQANNR